MHKKIFVLFFVSLMLTGYAAGSAYIERAVTVSSGILAGIGLFGLLICLVNVKSASQLGRRERGAVWRQVAAIIFWAVVCVGINIGAHKFDRTIDLTATGQHTLSDATKAFIDEVSEEVQLTVFYAGIPPKYLEDLLGRYARQSDGRITYEIVDPLVQIGYAAQFDSKISSEEKRLIVQSQSRRKDVNFTKSPLSENDINNAILQVGQVERTACFLIGHGEFDVFEQEENGLYEFVQQLGANNVNVARFVLGVTGGVPDDCNVLVIAGPKQEIPDDEAAIIQEYLHQGGDALIMAEHVIVTTPDKPLAEDELDKNPSLNNILNPWGLQVNKDIVVDLASHATGDVGSPATRNYTAHKEIMRNVDYTFYIRPRSISVLEGRRKSVMLAPMISTESATQSWGETNRMLEVKYNPDEDHPGPVPFAFVVFESNSDEDEDGTRIIVITDADFITNNYIDYYSNGLMGLKMINWLTEAKYQTFVKEKELKVETLQLTSRQKRLVIMILFIAPALILTAAFGVWLRGRN